MPPPTYEVSLEEGQPHERKFVLTVSVGKQSEQGLGKSKKLAKRKAANLMLERLKAQPAERGHAGRQHGMLAAVDGENGALADVDEDELVLGIAAR